MTREGQNITIVTPWEAEQAAIAAAMALDDKKLWKQEEVVRLWDVSQSGGNDVLPVELTVGTSRIVVRGLRLQAAREPSPQTLPDIRRIPAQLFLDQLKFPIVPGKKFKPMTH